MIKSLLAGAALAVAATSSIAGVITATVDYSLSTIAEGDLYTGSFVGTDYNADGVISFNELAAFTAMPTLNGSQHQLTALTLSDLAGFGDFVVATDTWIANGTSWVGESDTAYFTWAHRDDSFRQDFTIVSTTVASVTSVPEPASLAMIGLGVLVLAGSRRRKAARSAWRVA